jgi:NTE family protein
MIYFRLLWLLVLLLNGHLYAQTETLEFTFKENKLPFGLVEKVPVNAPVISLALSGGGARGIAQIGVLRALEEADIPFKKIIGTSMGSVIGGLYSAGYSLNQIDSIFKSTNWDELLAPDRETNRRDLFIDQKISEDKAVFALRLKGLTPVLPTSINNGQKLSNYLNLLILNAPVHQSKSFDELRYSFRSVCTDLVSGNAVVISSGSLSQAIRASSSVSFFLSPVRIDSLILVDGGLVANIPVKIASEISDYVIAVNTTGALHNEKELAYPWFIADQVVSIPMKLLNEAQLNNANVIITPEIGSKASSDFTNLDSVIDAGYQKAVLHTAKIISDADSLFISNLGIEEVYYNNITHPGNLPAASTYFSDSLLRDSVSNYDIYREMYRIYSTGNYKNIKAEITRLDDSTIINITSEFNPLVKDIKLIKKDTTYAAEQEEIFAPLKDKPYNAAEVVRLSIKALNHYRSAGYSLADIDKIIFEEKTGIVNIRFNEGIIDSVVILGNTFTNVGIIRREMPLEKGDYFSVNRVEEWLTNLRSTNLFDDINLTVNNEEGRNILTLRVLEKNSSVFRFGFRIDNENKIQAGLDIRDENLFGSGTELGLLISLGARNRNYILEHKSNRVFNTYLTYKINAFYQIDDAYLYFTDPQSPTDRFTRSIGGEYRQVYYGTSLAIGTQAGRFGNLILTGKYQFDELKNKTGSTVSPYKIKIVSLKLSSTIDTQDKYPYPTSGMYFSGGYETALTTLGGDVGFTNLSFDYKYHLTIDDIYTIVPKIMMGFADKTLPFSQQYSLGGQNSFLGMREDEFRGRQIFVSSIESRYKLPFRIFFDSYFRLRYDLGSVWAIQEQIKFNDLRHGIGVTISLDTPIGPADFSVGRSFMFRKPDNNSAVSFGEVFLYFSIGYYY